MPDRRIFYDTIAPQFDTIINKYEIEKRLKIIFTRLLPEPLENKLVLDMGCGTGWFTQRLLVGSARVVASDIGHQLLVETRKKYRDALLAQNSLERLGFASNTFDVIVCTEVIEHTPDPQHSVHELLRVLKPNGILILTVPNHRWHFSVTVANWFGIRPYKGYENWVLPNDLTQWVTEAGGCVEQLIGFNLFPLFYKPFHSLLNWSDRLSWLQPVMVNIGMRIRKVG
jgi:2-polyprenyl-3-methyl-5-hydroxy-6-metoxy-1,4-benzoquinol methylase